MALIDGVKVKFGEGRELIVPPLNLRGLKQNRDKIKSLEGLVGLPDDTQLEAIIDILHAALVRNYSAMTRDEVADMVDLANMKQVLPAALAVSGLVPRGTTPGEGMSPSATPGTTTPGTN